MTSYVLGILMIVGVFVVTVGQRWPRIWRALRFPDSESRPILSATVEQGIVQIYCYKNHTTYQAEIIYSYQVNGEYYSGRHKADPCNSEPEAEDIVKVHPKGSTLQIRVHPTKPDVSLLEY
jgi:hypothetical protein